MVILLVYAILVGLALGIIFSVARLATELPQYATKADSLVASATKQLAALGVGPEQLQQAAGSLNLGKLAAVLGALLTSVAGLATNFVFLMALLLFVSVESGGYHHRLASIAADRPQISEALGHFAWGTRQYLLVTTIFGGIVAVLDSIALTIMGIPLAITWGLLSFITNYIPNVGFIIGVVPPALLALLTGGPQLMIIVIVVYCGINLVVQSVIQPRFIGDAVGLSVTVTFLPASAEEPDPTAPKKRKRRGRHSDESDDREVPDREPVVDLSATPPESSLFHPPEVGPTVQPGVTIQARHPVDTRRSRHERRAGDGTCRLLGRRVPRRAPDRGCPSPHR